MGRDHETSPTVTADPPMSELAFIRFVRSRQYPAWAEQRRKEWAAKKALASPHVVVKDAQPRR